MFLRTAFSLGAGFGGVLLVRKDGHAKLLHDSRLPESAAGLAHVDEAVVVTWYDGISPGRGARQLALLQGVNPVHSGLRIHDRLGDPYAATLSNTLADMRRVGEDADERSSSAEGVHAGHGSRPCLGASAHQSRDDRIADV